MLNDVQVGAGPCCLPALIKERPADFVIEVFLGRLVDALTHPGFWFSSDDVIRQLAQPNFTGLGLVVHIALVDQITLIGCPAGVLQEAAGRNVTALENRGGDDVIVGGALLQAIKLQRAITRLALRHIADIQRAVHRVAALAHVVRQASAIAALDAN